MFDRETLNDFSGGFNVSLPGIITLFASPHFSLLHEVISFPISVSMNALIKEGRYVEITGSREVKLNFELSKLSNEWFDPIKLASNIAIQRGWKNPPYIRLKEGFSFNSGVGYFSAFIDLSVLAFSLVNRISLSNSEFIQISGEIQDKIRNGETLYQTVTRFEGKEGNVLFHDSESGNYRNETVNFEPYSLYILRENSLESNPNISIFDRNMKRFNDQRMINENPSSLKFPYSGMANHFLLEEQLAGNIHSIVQSGDNSTLLSALVKYSQSLGYNLGILSQFQKKMSSILERYNLQRYIYNISEYSGSFLLFLDANEFSLLKDNVIRDYYNLTNRTVTIDEVEICEGHSIDSIRT